MLSTGLNSKSDSERVEFTAQDTEAALELKASTNESDASVTRPGLHFQFWTAG